MASPRKPIVTAVNPFCVPNGALADADSDSDSETTASVSETSDSESETGVPINIVVTPAVSSLSISEAPMDDDAQTFSSGYLSFSASSSSSTTTTHLQLPQGGYSGIAPPLPPWRKLLWVKQPYPDNYVDTTFLSQLKQNSHVQPYTFWALSADFSSVLVHLCTVVHFVIVFVGIYGQGWSPVRFAGGSCVLTAGGYLWLRYYLMDGQSLGPSSSSEPGSLLATFKSALLILFTILALSPVLKSLTQSTSSDSIWALASWLVVGNIFANDYSSTSTRAVTTVFNADQDIELKSSLSTNLALSAAIVLASRLPTTIAVFSFVLFSIQLFGVFPAFVKRIRVAKSPKAAKSSPTVALRYSKTYWSLLATLVTTTYIGLWHICAGADPWFKLLVGGTWLGTQVAVMVVLPLWLLTLQKYKNEIQGPWDPAKPVLQNTRI
ncbi:uncharacterized protein SAPINGB_P004343 [Magnusiomyces paraingens]|uniref:Phosphatidylinositol N-acetylglucosaminyltransferase n=1 Tax=Magnusiomyces paraingens TaxID=2606893 RepID=A0A5E8BWC9_9ASCO|nr:uncharacterized protein SAPINGB_P004343 [Saprochaete ingens]VVT54949.1 unnamed protein product [Saprochaete ingens]